MSDARGRMLVFQHHPAEGLAGLGSALRSGGMVATTVELYLGESIPELETYDLLIAMGGPMDVWQTAAHHWLVDEMEAIRTWVEDLKRPFFGVCLGHQLLAAAMGGTVGPMAGSEIGVNAIDVHPTASEDPLFRGLGRSLRGLQWHGAEVTCPPPGSVVLASNEYTAVQAIRVGRRDWGVQFHIEAGTDTVGLWSAIPEYAAALAAHRGGDADWLRAEVEIHADVMDRSLTAVAGALLRQVDRARLLAGR